VLASERTNSRLYADGEPAESVSEAVVALTYGAKGVDEVLGGAEVLDSVAPPATAVPELSPPDEQPAQARVSRLVSPTADFTERLMCMYPSLSPDRSEGARSKAP
jgi:hypothetical protein